MYGSTAGRRIELIIAFSDRQRSHDASVGGHFETENPGIDRRAHTLSISHHVDVNRTTDGQALRTLVLSIIWFSASTAARRMRVL